MRKNSTYLLGVIPVFLAATMLSCGSNKDDNKDSGSGTKYTWENDMKALVAADCSSAGCHGTAAPISAVFEESEKNFLAKKTVIITRMSQKPGTEGYMPKDVSNYDATKLRKVIDFLSQ